MVVGEVVWIEADVGPSVASSVDGEDVCVAGGPDLDGVSMDSLRIRFIPSFCMSSSNWMKLWSVIMTNVRNTKRATPILSGRSFFNIVYTYLP